MRAWMATGVLKFYAKYIFTGPERFFHHITGFDPVDDVQALDHLTEAGMHPVEMGRMVAAVADEKWDPPVLGPRCAIDITPLSWYCFCPRVSQGML